MEKILKKYMKKNIPEIKAGDTVKVHQKIKEGDKERVQIFEGLVIATHGGKTLDGSFTVRKESFGVGVERIFPIHSPRVVKVERIKQSRVRRSKL
ncbi:50S ribosomal protein L19, partial [Candidatus Berkelbacteria bacterium CG08_land_8_20_14_0_20_39_8]